MHCGIQDQNKLDFVAETEITEHLVFGSEAEITEYLVFGAETEITEYLVFGECYLHCG